MSYPMHEVIRGRMTEADHAEIHRLSETLKRPTPGVIARRIKRHPATVTWYMLTHGLIERQPGYAGRPYMRRAKMIYPYSPEQDSRLIQLLSAPGDYKTNTARHRAVALALTAEFGIYRTEHSVAVRATQLAAAPEEAA